ncbi:hypothetical protein [Acidovorax sp.]|uniref:hypothetical protein n=1 Tax=Acidovorax sp. TaxID=1872122 RepID=UPI0025C543E9|nr:hypothetical protein [Acidovorax sp.]MBW8464867.1 hypothetical protein [Acidovorax sp.]
MPIVVDAVHFGSGLISIWQTGDESFNSSPSLAHRYPSATVALECFVIRVKASAHHVPPTTVVTRICQTVSRNDFRMEASTRHRDIPQKRLDTDCNNSAA